MSIDWNKVSELALEALFQGIISAIAVYLAFRLGQRESDRKWNKEQILRQIEGLNTLLNIINDLLEVKPDWFMTGGEECIPISETRHQELTKNLPRLYGYLAFFEKAKAEVKRLYSEFINATDDTLTDSFLDESHRNTIIALKELGDNL